MTSPPDVQNVPDVWGLLERARDAILQHNDLRAVVSDIRDALTQRDHFVLVPKVMVNHSVKLMPVWPTNAMLQAVHDGPLGAAGETMTLQVKQYLIEIYAAYLDSAPEYPQVPLLATAPKPEWKP